MSLTTNVSQNQRLLKQHQPRIVQHMSQPHKRIIPRRNQTNNYMLGQKEDRKFDPAVDGFVNRQNLNQVSASSFVLSETRGETTSKNVSAKEDETIMSLNV